MRWLGRTPRRAGHRKRFSLFATARPPTEAWVLCDFAPLRLCVSIFLPTALPVAPEALRVAWEALRVDLEAFRVAPEAFRVACRFAACCKASCRARRIWRPRPSCKIVVRTVGKLSLLQLVADAADHIGSGGVASKVRRAIVAPLALRSSSSSTNASFHTAHRNRGDHESCVRSWRERKGSRQPVRFGCAGRETMKVTTGGRIRWSIKSRPNLFVDWTLDECANRRSVRGIGGR